MEHINEILKKQTPTGTSKANTGTWSAGAKKDDAVCPVCQGAGFVHPRLPGGEPDYSRLVRCSCVKKQDNREITERLLKYSNIGALARLTFDNLDSQGRSGNPRSRRRFTLAWEAAKQFASEPAGWLVFGGPSGCGKTHLAAAIVNARIQQGHPALYLTAPDLLGRLRTSFSAQAESPFDETLENLKNAPLLVLDDLGVQSDTAWAKEKLDQLLTFRFNNELPTVVVTASTMEQLDDRLRTRLTDARLSRVFILEENLSASEYEWAPEFALQKTQTFSNFDRRRNLSPEQQENIDSALELALNFARNPEGWLVFMGETGCGKTHLAAAIVNYRYQAGEPALFVVVPEFLDHLRSTFGPESRISYDELFESVKTAPLLVLDDFGEQSTTPWAREKLYQVLNYRYNGRLPTVITMRFTFDDMVEKFDEPVISRLADGRLSVPFNITAPDYRTDVTHKKTSKPRPPRTRTTRRP